MKQSILLSVVFLFIFSNCKKEENPPVEQECVLSDSEMAFVETLNTQIQPFTSADPNIDDEQLNPLIDYLGTASFVSMGEGTHGTAEFYQLKDKLFRKLVTEKEFNAIIFEIPWGEGIVVNDYVAGSAGTLEESIDQISYWTYRTEEVKALAKWIHDYNQGLGEFEKVYFVGCDIQGADFRKEYNIISSYLNEVQADSAGIILDNYLNLPVDDVNGYESMDQQTHAMNIEGTQKVFDYFINNEQQFIANSSERSYEIALMATHVIQHREIAYRTSDFGIFRDSLMAVYAEWWQRILEPDAKVAVWAHNFHVSDEPGFSMGSFLEQNHQDNHKIVGFSFGRGAFNAFKAGANYQFVSGVQLQSVPDYECNTTNQLLSLTDGDQHYVIMEETNGVVSDYFSEAKPFLQFGAGFNYAYIHNYIQNRRLANLYDVLIHFDETAGSLIR